MSERPWLKFYPSDWRADAGLRACSLTSRGLWLEMLSLMHDAEPYGHLLINGSPPPIKTLCGLVNAHHKTVIACLKELHDAGVYSVIEGGVIVSRRMLRDQAKAMQDKENGRKGGNPHVVRKACEGVNPQYNRQVKAQRPEARVQKLDTSPSLRSGDGAPARKPAAKKRLAAENTLPSEPSPSMLAHAAASGFVNGRAEQLFAAWRDHHISRATPIADTDASFRTWVRNEIKFNRSPSHDQQPRLFGVAGQNAAFNERANRGALAALRSFGEVVEGGPEASAPGGADAGVPERRRLGHS